MIEDKLSHEERLRLECLSQAAATTSSGDIKWVLNKADKFEEYVRNGWKPEEKAPTGDEDVDLLPRDFEGKPVYRFLEDDLANVLASTVVGSLLSEAPEVKRVLARYRKGKSNGDQIRR